MCLVSWALVGVTQANKGFSRMSSQELWVDRQVRQCRETGCRELSFDPVDRCCMNKLLCAAVGGPSVCIRGSRCCHTHDPRP